MLLSTGFFVFKTTGGILSESLELDLSEPISGGYRSDEYVFLKTFYLMKDGSGYYHAYQNAFNQNAAATILEPEVFTWRLPTVFYLWKTVSHDGNDIFSLFVTMMFLSLVSIYFVLKRFTNRKVALLAPIFVLPYFIDTFLYKTSFLFVEWWGWFFLIFGMAFFVHNKKWVAFPCFLSALLVRELYIIPIAAFFLYSLFTKRNRVYFLGLVAIFGAFVFIHAQNVFSVLDGGSLQVGNVFSRFHGFEKDSFLPMISFSMRKYPLLNFKIHYVLVLLSLVSFAKTLIASASDDDILYLHLAGISLLIALPFITTSIYNDYWGISFMPTLILCVLLMFSKQAKQKR